MQTHELPARDGVRYRSFDRSHPPVLEVAPGDTIVTSTLDASWTSMAREMGENIPDVNPPPPDEQGHALTGPIAVRGAAPGDVLLVRIDDLVPGRFGWTWTGPRPTMPHFDLGGPEEASFLWTIDPAAGFAVDRHEMGIRLPIRPFLGVIGVAPSESGRHSTTPPRRVGGNIDCRELVAGSTLYLPVEVDGALLYLGDGHAVQGDGEVGQTALECPMSRVVVTVDIARVGASDWQAPRADTPAGYVTLGFGDTLGVAGDIALDAMLAHITGVYGVNRAQAMALASLAVDLHITQVVNGSCGVHATLPPGAIQWKPASA